MSDELRVQQYVVLADERTIMVRHVETRVVVDVSRVAELRAQAARLNEQAANIERDHDIRIPVSVRAG